MVGPSTLSTALGCPRRFRTLVQYLHSHGKPPRQEQTGGNDDHQREGRLLEAILQFIAVGKDVPNERKLSAIEDRYDLVGEMLDQLKLPGQLLTQDHAKALLLKPSNANALVGYSVADLASKMEESMTDFLHFIEDNELGSCRWQSEVQVESVLETPFGKVDASGRIDLLCHKGNNVLIIEIKKREQHAPSDLNQARFYAQLLGLEGCQISVINGANCTNPEPAKPVRFPFGPEDGDVTEASAENCNYCHDATCTDSVLAH
jgi:hypothetical protein